MNATQNHLTFLYNKSSIPLDHYEYLKSLKKEGFNPSVIYDIGSSVRHWQRIANDIWPDAKIYLFDAYEPYEFLYKDFEYHIGVLSDTDNRIVNFYQSGIHVGGNSYYKEQDNVVFPDHAYVEKKAMTLDTIVATRGFPKPDFVKMDVQGAELDIFNGAQETLKNTKYMVLEAQHVDYNRDAPKYETVISEVENKGWKCIAPRFCVNGADADYCFEKIIFR